MREILFRIWNGTSYEYDVMVGKFGAFYVNPMNDGLDVDDSASLSQFNTKFSDDVVIEQFTGLTDKNGKKIFEGDIISTDLARDFLVVEFNGGAFVFNCNDGDKDYYDHINASYELKNEYEYGEIIGNIHDNPELLS